MIHEAISIFTQNVSTHYAVFHAMNEYLLFKIINVDYACTSSAIQRAIQRRISEWNTRTEERAE